MTMLREKVHAKTYFEYGVEKLKLLCSAVGMNCKTEQIMEIFGSFTSSWGDRAIEELPSWLSDVGDDHAPFEFSVAFEDNQPELRILVEVQGSSPNLRSNWEAGLNINQRLADNYKVSLDRFDQVKDLFFPDDQEARFSMWHSVCFWPDRDPEFKIYLNPQAQGKSRAAAVIEESLMRLGFPRAWSALAEIAAQRGPDKDEFKYFSLDLSSHPRARVKVYLRHYDATPEDLEKALSAARNYVSGDATEFCQAMAESESTFSAKPVTSCFSFIEGDDDTPSSGTMHLPIAHYAPSDRVVRDRLRSYFIKRNLPVFAYDSVIQALATRPLDAGVGMQSYTSLRRQRQQRRVTVYLSAEVSNVQPHKQMAAIQTEKMPLSVEEMVWRYERDTIAHHPFLQRLQREPVNLTHLWLLFVNGREGIVTSFTRRLASVIARTDDEHIRCIFTKQLNDELGNGDFSRVHRKLFDRLIAAIEPWRPESVTQKMLVPGSELSHRLEELYSDPNPYVGVGAAMVMEIRGKQLDLCLGNEFRNRTTIDRSSLSWLTLHEELELGHADDSLTLARLIPHSDETVEPVHRGAEKTCAALCSFLDGMYRICFM